MSDVGESRIRTWHFVFSVLLCVSVVNVFVRSFTTETESTTEVHRELPPQSQI